MAFPTPIDSGFKHRNPLPARIQPGLSTIPRPPGNPHEFARRLAQAGDIEYSP